MKRNDSVGEQASDGSRVWVPSIVACFARFLSANEVACILRLVDKATSQQYADCKTVRLSLPSPAHIFKKCWGRPESFRGYTRNQRMKLLCLTAASGSISNLQVALANAGLCVQDRRGSELFEAAAEAGQLDVCMMLLEHGCDWGDSLQAAARGGHRHVCKWMLASGCPFSYAEPFFNVYPGEVDTAARGGHEGLMQWLMTYQIVRPTVVDSLLRAAAAGLSLVAFQRLHQQLLTGQQHGCEAQQQQQPVVVLDQVQRVHILATAAGSPTPDWQAKVEWLEGQGYPQTHWACASAAACSPDEEAVSRLQYLCSRGYTPDVLAVREAASHGNLAALCLLVEQAGVQPDLGQAGVQAAKHGRLAVLQYLHTRGRLPLEAHFTLVQRAAEKGHLPVVVWAVEALGVAPDDLASLLNCAAGSGSVELMAWLRERGWTWKSGTIAHAAMSGCEEAVEWLVERGCPWKEEKEKNEEEEAGEAEAEGDAAWDLEACLAKAAAAWDPEARSAYARAVDNSDLAMIRCLHRLGCPWGTKKMADYISSYDSSAVPLLRCLRELGCPVDWDKERADAAERTMRILCRLGEGRQRQLLGGAQQ